MLEGDLVRLRALEPGDAELLYRWENDPQVWGVSGTTAPFSRHVLQRFIDEQVHDIYRTRQLRLVIETCAGGRAVGTVDLYDFDPMHRRAGVGILVHAAADRGRGYASQALELLCRYAFGLLELHQLYACAGASNRASLKLFRRAGFVQAGLRREWNRTGQGWEDEVLLQRLATPRRSQDAPEILPDDSDSNAPATQRP